MTRTSLSRSKGQRSRSPCRFTHRGVYTSGSCSGHRGNVFTVGTYTATLPSAGAAGGTTRFGAHRGRRVAGAYSGGRAPTACCYHCQVLLLLSSLLPLSLSSSLTVVTSSIRLRIDRRSTPIRQQFDRVYDHSTIYVTTVGRRHRPSITKTGA